MQNFESLVKLARGATDKTVAIATAPAPNAQAGSKLPQFINLDIVTTDGTVSISGPDGVWEIDIRNFAEQPRLSSDPDGHPQTTPRVRPVGSTALNLGIAPEVECVLRVFEVLDSTIGSRFILQRKDPFVGIRRLTLDPCDQALKGLSPRYDGGEFTLENRTRLAPGCTQELQSQLLAEEPRVTQPFSLT
jgi:hypothetical protein